MTHQLNEVLTAIQSAGGKIRPRDLIEALSRNHMSKRDIQFAVQAALDKGLVSLDRDMQLTATDEKVHEAA